MMKPCAERVAQENLSGEKDGRTPFVLEKRPPALPGAFGSGDVTRTHDTPGMNENCHGFGKRGKHMKKHLNYYDF